jgi:hypothetical protein
MTRAARLLVLAAVTVLLVALAPQPVSALSSPPSVAWAQRAGGAGDDNASGLTVDGAGNLYVTGKFGGTSTWGTGPSAVTLNAAGGSRDIYVASYQSDGALRWVVKAGGTGYDEGRDIAVDGSGHVYVTGQFTRTASFGPGPGAVSYTTSPADFSDIFLARYDAATGDVQWVVRAGGSANDIGFGVALDGAGAPVITGQFSGTATFGIGGAARTITAAGGTDVFVARYGAAAGGLQWVVKAGRYGQRVRRGGRDRRSRQRARRRTLLGLGVLGMGRQADVGRWQRRLHRHLGSQRRLRARPQPGRCRRRQRAWHRGVRERHGARHRRVLRLGHVRHRPLDHGHLLGRGHRRVAGALRPDGRVDMGDGDGRRRR